MKVIGLVAVRMKSSRLKNKALLDLNGKSLILQLLLRLRRSKKMDDVVLCTSVHEGDKILLDLADEHGFKSFAGSENDVMNRFIIAGEREKADIIVRITGDNPLTDPELIDVMVESHIELSSDYTRVRNLPIGVTAEVITFTALKKAFELAEDSGFSEYMTNYFVEYPEVFKLNLIAPDDNLKRPEYRLTIDYPEDYELMKKIFLHFSESSQLAIKDVIKFLDDNPDVAKINSRLKPIPLDLSINTKLK